MNKDLSQSALTALGSAVVASVIVSWTLTTFTLGRIDRELDQIHNRLRSAYEPVYASPAGEDAMSDEAGEDDTWEMPEAPE